MFKKIINFVKQKLNVFLERKQISEVIELNDMSNSPRTTTPNVCSSKRVNFVC